MIKFFYKQKGPDYSIQWIVHSTNVSIAIFAHLDNCSLMGEFLKIIKMWLGYFLFIIFSQISWGQDLLNKKCLNWINPLPSKRYFRQLTRQQNPVIRSHLRNKLVSLRKKSAKFLSYLWSTFEVLNFLI